MKREQAGRWVAVGARYFSLGLCGLGVAVFMAGSAQAAGNLEEAPVNPEFSSHREASRALAVPEITEDGHGLGYAPAPVYLPHLIGAAAPRAVAAALPVSYDLRTTGKLTPVKDQGACGSCWAFATMGSLESMLRPSETWDFSENNLKNTAGFDYDHCFGGNSFMSLAYLTRWDGPVTESDDPYTPSSPISPGGLLTRKHLQEAVVMPARTGPTDNDVIKQAVMEHGAVMTNMYWTNASYSGNNAYYYSGTADMNHLVTIVGWDDQYSRANFATTPPGDGAFIIRNSWGEGWGDGGYFYLSYHDTNCGKWNVVFNGAEVPESYSHVYQYDPLGWVVSYGYGGDTAWFANIFPATANESIHAVSFYTPSPASTYEIQVYTNVAAGPTSGTLANTTSGVIPMAGYHTLSLAYPVPVAAGEEFSVVVKLTSPGYNWPIAVEIPYSGYSSGATAGPGQSYVSPDGASWSDFAVAEDNGNVCLKAFADFTPPVRHDFNGDGHSDLLWHRTDGQNQLWLVGSDGLSLTRNATMGQLGSKWGVVGTGDFNGDRNSDLLYQDQATGQLQVYLTSGDGVTMADRHWLEQAMPPSSGWVVFACADFNGDGRDDILWHRDADGANLVWQMAPDGISTTSKKIIGKNWPRWTLLATGDFNNDRRADLLYRDEASGQQQIHLTSPDGLSIATKKWFGAKLLATSGWQFFACTDFNGDGADDILWNNPSNGANLVWYTAPATSALAGTKILGRLATLWSLIDTGDYNGDGNADLLYRDEASGQQLVYLTSADGQSMATKGKLTPLLQGSDGWSYVGK